MLSYEYKGFDQTSADDWNTTDFRIGTVLGPQLGTLDARQDQGTVLLRNGR